MKTRWVLLRGLTREAAHWGTFIDAFQAASGDVVAALDLPGSGTSREQQAPLRVAAAAASCRRALPPHDGPTVLLALSLGAMVALEWCRQDPAQVAGCVLVNTSAGGLAPFWQRLRPGHYGTILRMLAGLSLEERERRLLQMTSARPAMHGDVVAQWIEIGRRRPVAPLAALRQLGSAARYRVPSVAPGVPMLVLGSAGDALVSPECSRRLAQRWGLPLREHPWAGHDLPLDDPDWVIEQVLAWWHALERRSPQ